MDELRSGDGLPSATPESPGFSQRPAFTIVAPRRVVVAPTILALNVIVFVAMVASGADFFRPTIETLRAFGADHGPDVADGEWWRLLTNTFVHAGILHIGVNMWVFRSLGAAVERLFGNAAFALLYVASALGASITSMLWNPAGVSVGASGAVFGVAGAFLAFFLGHRQAMPVALFRTMTKSLLSFVVINVMFGLIVPGIDNAAHIGGLFTGFIAGYVLNRDVRIAPDLDRRRAVRAALLFVVLFAIGSLIPWRVRTDSKAGPQHYSEAAASALERNEFDEVIRVTNEWIAAQPNDAQAFAIRGVARYGTGDEGGARDDLDHALGIEPDLPYALGCRARLRIQGGDVEGALRDYDAYIEQLPASTFGFRMRAHARYSHRDWPGSLRDFQSVIGLAPAEASNARLYVWVLRSRLSMREEATDELRRALGQGITAEWDRDSKPIALFLAGEIDEQKLDAAMLDSARPTASFFCGMKRLFDGDRQGAIGFFKRCIESGDPHSFETFHAREELDLLAK